MVIANPAAKVLAAALLVTGLAACHHEHEQPVLRIADVKGAFRVPMEAAHVLDDAPYRVEWGSFPTPLAGLEALSAKAVDLAPVGDAAFLFAYANGLPARVIATSRREERTGDTAIVVRNDEAIHRIADLKGRTIAVTRGSAGHYLLLTALKAAGLKPDDVHLSFLAPTDGKTALLSGSVDAWAGWDPMLALAELHDHARPIVDSKDLGIHSQVFTVASPEAIAAKRAMIEDFLARHARAEVWARNHPDAYAQALSKATALPLAAEKAVVARGSRLTVPLDDRALTDFEKAYSVYHQAGLVSEQDRLDKAFDRSFPLPGGADQK